MVPVRGFPIQSVQLQFDGSVMTRKIIPLTAMFFAVATLPATAAGDAEAGKKKAGQCQTCHGMDGISKLPEAPNIAGQNQIYLVKALNDYKSGARKNDMMGVIMGPLTPDDINDLAAYYASIKITVSPPK
jgi:cytochrome c553